MPDANDMDLIQEYADRNSEPAFAGLVHRHINLVYSVALRFTGNSPDAQDVTQAVFIILAQKAASLCQRTTLTGWLYETTRFTARQLLRTRARQQAREQEAYMQSTLNDSNSENVWRQLAPLLEEAMARLSEKERTLVALRFFENKSAAETAALLGIQEWAAHKRAARAMEKLRQFFVKRGTASTTATLAGAISANSVQAAPVMLAKSVTAVAIAKGATASVSTLTLIKGALKIMAWTKTQTAIVAGVVVLLAAGTTTVVVKEVTWANDPRIWQGNLAVLNKLPEVILLRPTKFTNEPSGTLVGFGTTIDGHVKDARKNVDIRELLNFAYGMPPADMVRSLFPQDLPHGNFDFLFTLPRDVNEVLRNELKTRFELTAHRENREADALLIRLTNLKNWERNTNQKNQDAVTKSTIDDFIPLLEEKMGKPVVNQTGLTEHYNLDLQWNTASGEVEKENIKQALLDQLGLELVPTNMPIEILVVEKAQ